MGEGWGIEGDVGFDCTVDDGVYVRGSCFPSECHFARITECTEEETID